MIKGQRPSIHRRIVNTKKGRVVKLINPNVVRKYKFKGKPGTIATPERKILNYLSDPKQHKVEYGGFLDFNKKGKLENFLLVPGKKYYVDLPADYEVLYHTHPFDMDSPPSPDDVVELLKNKHQQAEMVIRNGKTFILVKTPATKKLEKEPRKKLKSITNKYFVQHFYKPGADEKIMKEYEKMGFIAQINNPSDKPIQVKIKPVEPKK